MRPLRQAIYFRLNCGSVLEILPHWDPDAAEGKRKIVELDDKLDNLLDSPREAYEEFFGDEKKPENVFELEWKNHIFCKKSVIAELCVWARPDLDYLELLRSFL